MIKLREERYVEQEVKKKKKCLNLFMESTGSQDFASTEKIFKSN